MKHVPVWSGEQTYRGRGLNHLVVIIDLWSGQEEINHLVVIIDLWSGQENRDCELISFLAGFTEQGHVVPLHRTWRSKPQSITLACTVHLLKHTIAMYQHRSQTWCKTSETRTRVQNTHQPQCLHTNTFPTLKSRGTTGQLPRV